jgi:hypothetical protein
VIRFMISSIHLRSGFSVTAAADARETEWSVNEWSMRKLSSRRL